MWQSYRYVSSILILLICISLKFWREYSNDHLKMHNVKLEAYIKRDGNIFCLETRSRCLVSDKLPTELIYPTIYSCLKILQCGFWMVSRQDKIKLMFGFRLLRLFTLRNEWWTGIGSAHLVLLAFKFYKILMRFARCRGQTLKLSMPTIVKFTLLMSSKSPWHHAWGLMSSQLRSVDPIHQLSRQKIYCLLFLCQLQASHHAFSNDRLNIPAKISKKYTIRVDTCIGTSMTCPVFKSTWPAHSLMSPKVVY